MRARQPIVSAARIQVVLCVEQMTEDHRPGPP